MIVIFILYIKKKNTRVNVMEDLDNDFDWTRNKLIWNLGNYYK